MSRQVGSPCHTAQTAPSRVCPRRSGASAGPGVTGAGVQRPHFSRESPALAGKAVGLRGRDPPVTPLTLVPHMPQARGPGPQRESSVTLSLIFPSEEPISSAVRLLPTPTQALLLLQGPLGNTGLLPTGSQFLPILTHHGDAPAGTGVSRTSSPGGAHRLARGCPAESS